MLRALLPLTSIILAIAALADCIQTEDSRVRGIPKWAWIILIVIIPWVGPLTWLLVGRDGAWWFRFVGDAAQSGLPRRGEQRAARGVAPDDDDEFLRRLADDIEREKRRRPDASDEHGGEERPS